MLPQLLRSSYVTARLFCCKMICNLPAVPPARLRSYVHTDRGFFPEAAGFAALPSFLARWRDFES